MRVRPGAHRRVGPLSAPPTPSLRALVAREGQHVLVTSVGDDGTVGEVRRLDAAGWIRTVRTAAPRTRWIWNDTRAWYPELLAAGITVQRCHDLRLCHAILRDSTLVSERDPLRAETAWDRSVSPEKEPDATLFDLDTGGETELPASLVEVHAEFARQDRAVADARNPAALRLLTAAESAGGLLAAELHAAGLPWSRRTHEQLLEETLGPRPVPGRHPRRIEELAAEIRRLLGDETASLDSQPKLLRSLHRIGISARSTSRWELAEYDHPVIEPLLAYKKLTRLLSANGWAWLDEWARDGRFRPVYVPGGVVTGRWASSGGGALQLPRSLRPAVRADPGWTLVTADVAQLEPRVLAAMSHDLAMADAARGTDLYAGIVAAGVVPTRQEAKIAVLGAMYGATTGDSGRLVPALRRAYPSAMGLVDAAAQTGEAGGIVDTWLGRSCPPPSAMWHRIQGRAAQPDAGETDRAQARRSARDRGRFTRNFVVQGTAAEWALAWLAELRAKLSELPEVPASEAASASGPVFSRRAHLAFFLHDEVIIHAPASHAEAAAAAVREAAERATELLFGGFPLDFPLDLRITPDAAKS